MKAVWHSLKKPIFALAPMEDVTDSVFRQVVASCARPDVFFTEFTNVEGLNSKGREAIIHRLKFTQDERPIIAQIWGTKPEDFYKTATELVELGFDGIDINMGCPQKDVTSHGACAALMNNPSLAKEIIHATKEGASSLPISVKTRIGFKTINTEQWISHLLSCDIAALTVHGRTASEMSKVPAHWDEIAKAVRTRNDMRVETVILGNGDISSRSDALNKIAVSGVDGVMIGRAVFDDPWIFDSTFPKISHTTRDLLNLLNYHGALFESTWGPAKNFSILKKFFKIYVKGFENASAIREQLMETKSLKEVGTVISSILGYGEKI